MFFWWSINLPVCPVNTFTLILHFYTNFCQTVDKIISKYDKYIFIGDFNYDMLNCEKSAMLRDICDIFNMKNIVQKATCFTKIAKATLLDLILTFQE